MSVFYLVKQADGSIKQKRPYRKLRRLGKGLAVATVATISFASLSGCEFEEGNGSQFSLDPLNPTEATEVITTTDKEGNIITVTPTPSASKNVEGSAQSVENTTSGQNGNSTAGKSTPTPKPTNNITSTSAVSPIPKPTGQGSGNATDTPSPTNNTTAEPTSTPSSSSEQTLGGGESSSGSGSESSSGSSHTADPYSESCDCPYCSGDVSYHSAKTVHHDAVTHDETEVYYDRIVRTYQYTIVWSDHILNYCADNGIDLPSPPSATGSVIFDEDWNTLDDSGEDNALDSIFDEASDIASDVGFSGAVFGYTSEVIGDEYEGRHESTTTIVDEEAWDENIPAGWYCDSCDYYSASVPRAYDDIDI